MHERLLRKASAQVAEFEKHLVLRGLFEDPAAVEECAHIRPLILFSLFVTRPNYSSNVCIYLEQCYHRLQTTLKDARRREEVRIQALFNDSYAICSGSRGWRRPPSARRVSGDIAAGLN